MRAIDTKEPDNYPLPYSPKACAVSGRAEGQFVDFNVVIDTPEPTRLYMAREIVEEAARDLYGMVSEGKAKQLEEWLDNARKERDELQDTLDAAATLEERAGPGSVNRRELARAR